MKWALAFAINVIACTAHNVSPVKAPGIEDLQANTVAIYTSDSAAARCTGVWVDNYRILTAAHCEHDDEGNPLFYSIAEEYVGVFREPIRLHSMQAMQIDRLHDLALYRTGVFDTPQHGVAVLAEKLPTVGSSIFFMGNPFGLTWSFRQGWVSAYREADVLPFMDVKRGPWLQGSLPIYNGDSGGAAYDSEGHLVGIASMILDPVPSTGFFVYLPTIREFLR